MPHLLPWIRPRFRNHGYHESFWRWIRVRLPKWIRSHITRSTRPSWASRYKYGIGPAQCQQVFRSDTQIILGISPKELPHQGGVEVIETCSNSGMGRKYIACPSNGQRFFKSDSCFPHKLTGALQHQECGMAFVHMKDFRFYM